MPEYEVKLKITTDASGAITGTKRVGDELKNLENTAKSSGNILESAWTKAAAGVAALGYAINKALDVADVGSKALQIEESFNNVAQNFGIDADKLISDLMRVTNATVDDTDAMRQAMRAMTSDFNADQIVKMAEMARVAARRSGEDVAVAFEKITDAIEMNTPKALKNFGLVSKEEAKLIEKAKALGVEVDLLTVANLNYQIQLAAVGEMTETTSEKVQQAKVWWEDLKETIGVGVISAYKELYEWLEKVGGKLYQIGHKMVVIDRNGIRVEDPTYEDFFGGGSAGGGYNYATALASMGSDIPAEESEEVKKLIAERDAFIKKLKEEIEAKKELRKQTKAGVDEEKKLAKELRDTIVKNTGESYEVQIALLEAEYKTYEQKIKDKKLLEEWLASEKKRIWSEFYVDEGEWQSWLNETTMQLQADGLEEQAKARQEDLDEHIESLRKKREETERTTQEMTNSYAEFFGNIFGMGNDLASWWSNLGARLKGGLLAGVTEMGIGAISGTGSAGYSASGRFVSGLLGGGGSGGGGFNISGMPFGSLFSGMTIGQVPYQLAMALPTWLPGYETIFGGLAGVGDAMAGSSGLLGELSSIPLAAIGAVAAIGSLVYSFAKKKSAIHEMRRDRRGVFWGSGLGTLANAEDWESMVSAASGYPMYLGGRDWLEGGGEFRPYTQNNEKTGAWEGWSSGVKTQWAGWKHTSLSDPEKGLSEEDYWKTLSWWDDIAAAALNSLDSQKHATAETTAELGKYKDKIELTKELMPGWGEDAQAMAEAMIAMYENMQKLAIDDLWEKFEKGEILFSDLSKAIDGLDLDPMTKATELAGRAFKGFTEDVALGTDKFWEMYQVFREQTAAVGDLATAQERMAAVQDILSTNMDLSQEQVLNLVAYYRLLKDVLEGNIESIDDLGAAWARVQGIVEAATGDQTRLMLQLARWQHAGYSDVNQGWGLMYQRWGWGSDVDTERIRQGVDWALTKATMGELTAIAEQHGMTVEELIADLQWMDQAIKDSAQAAADAAEEYRAGVKDTASLMAVARAQMRGATPEELGWIDIRQRWGWTGDNQKGEAEIRAGLDWFLNEATPEQIYGMAQAKGMSVQQMISDLLFMGEQLGYFSSAVEDATDSIRDLEQAAESWKSLSQSLTQQIRGIAFSDANPQTAVERMGLVYQTIQGITGGRSIEAYLGGISDIGERQDAVQELSDLWGEYLQLAQEAYQRPSNQYQREYDLTLQNLEALKDYSLSEYDIALQQLEALRQIVANTSPVSETPAGGDGAGVGGGTGDFGGKFGWNAAHTYTINYFPGVGEDARYAPSTANLPPNYHWVQNYADGRPFWYAIANSPKDAIPIYHTGGLVRKTGPIYAEEGEYVIPKAQAARGVGNITVSITVNGANKTNGEVAREIRAEVISALRTAQAGAVIKDHVKWGGRG